MRISGSIIHAARILHKMGWKHKNSLSKYSLYKKIENGCEICPNSADYVMFFKSRKTNNMFPYLVCTKCKDRISNKETEIDMEIKTNTIKFVKLNGRKKNNTWNREFKGNVKILLNQCTRPDSFDVMILDYDHLFYKPIYDCDSLDTFIPEMIATRHFDGKEYRVNLLQAEFGNRYNIVLYHGESDVNQKTKYNIIGKIHKFTLAECQKCQYPFSYRYEGGPLRKRCPECVDWTKLYKYEYE